MQKTRQIKLDECTKTIVNQDGDKTLGDILCSKIDFFYNRGDFLNKTKPDSVNDIEITFQYSACGGSWTQIANNKKLEDGTIISEPLEAPEKLCCQRSNGEFKFRRCDGTSFRTTCKLEE